MGRFALHFRKCLQRCLYLVARADGDSEPDCNAAAVPFTYPGIRDLTHYDFDNVISSYRCNALGGLGKGV
jgi:hypothetical protein